MLRPTVLSPVFLALAAAASLRGQEPRDPAAAAPPAPVLTISQDTSLDPAVVYGGLVIAADGVTVEGHGARIVGPVRRAAEAAGTVAPTSSFTGTGVRAAGVANVTLRGLRVQGFELGVLVEDGSGWRLEDCDLSDNFHDPEFGWGEQGEKGGLLLRRVKDSALVRNRANRCWNACSLVECSGLSVQDNDFSHASNTCLKLWTVTRSSFSDNDISWGLRIAPGEVHARDSACVLIESGSDENRFLRNDATHGGDGFFIRVLNNWTSRRNLFQDNDASWANNNGFEAWSPQNDYLDNRANHCSYGFWLGASDKTRLLGNEAGWNGDPAGFHNAPESFGHGGIVFVNGPSNHTLVDGNWLHHNAGGGLVLRGDEATDGKAWKAWHWIIQRNRIEANRWGVWMRHASFIDIGPNEFAENAEGDVFDAGDVSNMVRHEGVVAAAPSDFAWSGPSGTTWNRERLVMRRGETHFEARPVTSPPNDRVWFRWGMDDGQVHQEPILPDDKGESFPASVSQAFQRVGVTATAGALSSMGWIDVYADNSAEILRASTDPAQWSTATDAGGRVSFSSDRDGTVHARITTDGDGRMTLLWPAARAAAVPIGAGTHLAFAVRARNPNIPAWQATNPVLTVHQSADRWLRLTPSRDWLGNPPDIHFRDEMMPLDVPLDGGDGWTRETGPGGAPDVANWIEIGVDSWGAPPLDLWIDGLSLRPPR